MNTSLLMMAISLNDDKKRYAHYNIYLNKEGFYYYDFSHTYQHLTSKEVDDFENFCVKMVADARHCPLDLMHVEDGFATDLVNGKSYTKYVKIGSRYMGKLILNYIYFSDDNYYANMTFLKRLAIPKHSYWQAMRDPNAIHHKKEYHTKDKKV